MKRKAIGVWLGVVAMGAASLLASVVRAEEDHLLGVKIKDDAAPTLTNTYLLHPRSYGGNAVTCELKKPKFLLLPAEKDMGNDPRGGLAGKFMCYKAKCEGQLIPITSGEDQFSAGHAVTIKKTQLVCAPFIDPDAPRFVDNGDGTVIDTQTHLMWEKKDDLGGIHDKDDTYDWSASGEEPDGPAFIDFIGVINGADDGICFAGHCDWRLPTIEELQTIRDATQGICGGGSGPCIDPVVGPTTPGGYWSGTTSPSITTNALALNFGSNSSAGTNGKNNGLFVRAVRGGL